MAGRRLELSRALTERVLAEQAPIHRRSFVDWLRLQERRLSAERADVPRSPDRGRQQLPDFEPHERRLRVPARRGAQRLRACERVRHALRRAGARRTSISRRGYAGSGSAAGTQARRRPSSISGTRRATSADGRTGGCWRRRRPTASPRPSTGCASSRGRPTPPSPRLSRRRRPSPPSRPADRARRCAPLRDARRAELLAGRARDRLAARPRLRRHAGGIRRDGGNAVPVLRARLAVARVVRARRGGAAVALGARRDGGHPGRRTRAGAAFCSRRVGLVAAALVAVHPFLVWYSQEARSYSLLVLLGAVHGPLPRPRARRAAHASISRSGRSRRRSRSPRTTSRSSSSRPRRPGSSPATAARRDAVAALLVPAARPRRAPAAPARAARQRRDGRRHVAAVAGRRHAEGARRRLQLPRRRSPAAFSRRARRRRARAPRDPRAPEERRGALVAGSLAARRRRRPARPRARRARLPDRAQRRRRRRAGGGLRRRRATRRAVSGSSAGAALCALLLADHAVGLARRTLRAHRLEGRGARSSSPPSVERAIVVTPYMSRSLWSPYLPGLEEPSGTR